jgi:hypothetical protein
MPDLGVLGFGLYIIGGAAAVVEGARLVLLPGERKARQDGIGADPANLSVSFGVFLALAYSGAALGCGAVLALAFNG